MPVSSGCYAFEANDSYGDGWNEGYVEISSINSDVDFGVTELIIELENGSLSYTVFQINDSDCIYKVVLGVLMKMQRIRMKMLC